MINSTRSLFLFLLVCAALPGCKQTPAKINHLGDKFYGLSDSGYNRAASGTPYVDPAYGSKEFITYTVKRGDTLSQLAERNNLSLKELVQQNGLKKPYDIHVGQVLKLRRATQHKVVRGDTLHRVATEYAVDMQALAAANGIDAPYNINVGQVLKMPHAVSGRAAPTRAVAAKKSVQKKSVTSSKKPAAKAAPEEVSATAPRFIWPVRGKVIEKFGAKVNGVANDGINIAAKQGEPVKSAAAGEVVYAGEELKAYGKLLIIKHDGGWISAYAHNDEILVKRAQKVNQGETVARVGKTGKVTAPQVHFGIRKGSEAIDPLRHLPK